MSISDKLVRRPNETPSPTLWRCEQVNREERTLRLPDTKNGRHDNYNVTADADQREAMAKVPWVQ